jgi:large subunit ribosomal protein L35Ae
MATGTVIQFRRGRKTYKPRHFIIEVEGLSSRDEAKKLEGKKVSWTSTGKTAKVINGKVSSAHGNKGVVRAIFERGLPGQAIGTTVEIEGEMKKKVEKKEESKKVGSKEVKKSKEVKTEDASSKESEEKKE